MKIIITEQQAQKLFDDNESISNKINDLIKNSKIIGKGNYGTAYLLKNGNVLKITRSEVEANIFKTIVGKTPEHISNIYWLNELGKNEDNTRIFAYEREYVDINWTKEEEIFWNETLLKYIDYIPSWKQFKLKPHNEKINITKKHIIDVLGDGYWGIQQYSFDNLSEERILFLMEGMENVIKDLQNYKISLRWLDPSLENFGIKRNGNFTIFDIGY